MNKKTNKWLKIGLPLGPGAPAPDFACTAPRIKLFPERLPRFAGDSRVYPADWSRSAVTRWFFTMNCCRFRLSGKLVGISTMAPGAIWPLNRNLSFLLADLNRRRGPLRTGLSRQEASAGERFS